MSGQADKAGIRDLKREDLPAVGRLFQKTFRKNDAVPPSLLDHLHQIFFDHPWYDENLPSKVFVDADGNLEGFVGVFPARLELNGRVLRAAFAGSLMVERPAQNPLAGARLLRAFLAGPQDISLTETANSLALGMWQKAGLPLDTGYSMSWLRVLRPASAVIGIMEQSLGAARLLRPVGRLVDGVAERSGLSSLRALRLPENRRSNFQDVTRDEFVAALLELKDGFPLRPRWDQGALDWFMRQAEQKRNLGRPVRRIGRSRDGGIVGCYAYHGRPGRIARLLQALCTPAAAGDLVDDLFAHADAAQCAGIRGGGHPWLAAELVSRKAVFYGRSFFVAHARDKTLLEPVLAGRALISGLAGENWTRLVGDRFD